MRMLRWVVIMVSLLLWAGAVGAVERFPAPDFRSGHQMPKTEVSPVVWAGRQWVDVGVLVGALAVGAWLVFGKRSRRGVLWLMVFSLVYFGFYRKGCICPVGAIGNVALSAGGNGYALPWAVALFFVLPLLFSLFYGRVFCAGVCALGAIQDVVLLKPIHIPAWVEQMLGVFAYAYLGLAVMYAGVGSELIICRYDPFVGFFRLSAPAHMLFLGAVFLVISMYVGRTYCRFVCPYGALLRMLSVFSKRRVSITPKDCVDCRLCEQACPFGAIRYPTQKEKAGRKDNGKGQLVMAIVMLPVLVGVFAGMGYMSRGLLARRDLTIQLAERVWQEEHGVVTDVTDVSRAFRGTGQTVDQLNQQANGIRHRFAIGASVFGAWVGLVVGSKLIALIIRRQRTGYTADPAGCVACARCYLSCPVEHDRLGQQELVVA
ncbi:MAG: 4Fe-4S binding protein [Planctomycetota bacterium]|nr:4Fe-4S binding protein [Planctomycetota bacterium]